MVHDEFFKVLPRLLELQEENDTLLQPVRSLEEIVRLEVCGVGAVRVELIVGSAIEVPDGGVVHNIQPVGPEYREVNTCV